MCPLSTAVYYFAIILPIVFSITVFNIILSCIIDYVLYRPKFAYNLKLLNIHHQNTRLPIDSVYYLLSRINQIYINQYNILEES